MPVDLSQTASRARPAAPRYRSPVVRSLRMARAPVIAAALLWLLAGLNAVDRTSRVAWSVGHETVTSIEAALGIGAGVGKAHGAFLSSLVAMRSGDPEAAVPAKGLDDVVDGLVTASRNITFTGEEAVVRDLSRGLGRYDVAAARADSPEAAAAARSVRAADAVEVGLVASADGLATINKAELDRAWDGRGDRLAWWLLALATAALLGALAYAQAEMALRTRRLLNAFLAPATLVVIVSSFVVGTDLSRASAAVAVAKSDAFDSIDALWRTRSLAAQAHDAVLEDVLDAGARARQSADAETFSADAFRILPDDARAAEAMGQGGRPRDVGGLLGAELGNVTFQGEADAARAMARTWVDLARAERAVLSDVQASGLTDGRALAAREVGALRSADEAYGRFEAAADRVTHINHEAFASSSAEADRALLRLDWWVALGALATLALSYLGFRQRLDEYGR